MMVVGFTVFCWGDHMKLTNRQFEILKFGIAGGGMGLLSFIFRSIKTSLTIKIYLSVVVLVLVGLINTMIHFSFKENNHND